MNPVSSQEMKSIDALASSMFGISSLTLMENAGREVASLVPPEAKSVLIFCGKGNNGGDGFVAARHLMNKDRDVSVVLLADPADLKGEAKLNFELAVNMGARLVREKSDCDFIIDAIFGIGLRSEVRGIHREAIEWINKLGKPVLAVDIPSGLNADTGEVLGVAVRATITAALGLPKNGFYKGAGPDYCGQVKTVDIGLPKSLLEGLTA